MYIRACGAHLYSPIPLPALVRTALISLIKDSDIGCSTASIVPHKYQVSSQESLQCTTVFDQESFSGVTRQLAYTVKSLDTLPTLCRELLNPSAVAVRHIHPCIECMPTCHTTKSINFAETRGLSPSYRPSILLSTCTPQVACTDRMSKIGLYKCGRFRGACAQPHRKYCLSHLRLQQLEALEQLAPGILQARPTGAVGVCIRERQVPGCMLLNATRRRQSIMQKMRVISMSCE